jgi:hypothetical protein
MTMLALRGYTNVEEYLNGLCKNPSTLSRY